MVESWRANATNLDVVMFVGKNGKSFIKVKSNQTKISSKGKEGEKGRSSTLIRDGLINLWVSKRNIVLLR